MVSEPGQSPHSRPSDGTPFVGRESQLAGLTEAFAAATSSGGQLVIVAGEPGIGKSALCARLAALVTGAAGCALLGRCDDAGGLSVPYLPFVEALRAALVVHDAGRIVSGVGDLAADLGRILPELHAAPTALQSLDPAEARYRILQAFAAALRTIAAITPTVLILEDLQDADQGTLDVLAYVGRHLAETRLLLVGTVRDTEVDSRHRLSETLATIRRSIVVDRIQLRGLDPEAVEALVHRIAQHPLSPSAARSVYEQTEGNPLFVWELMRQRAQLEQFLWGAPPLGRRPDSLPVPTGLRDVIGTRLARLSPECQQVLAVAAVIGREFSLEIVQAVTGRTLEDVAAALTEAVHTAVLAEHLAVGGAQYRFAHALFRQVLYDQLPAAERARWHPSVANAIEARYGRRSDLHATELADHLSRSTDPADLARALDYSRLGAMQAMTVFAAAEAAELTEQALAIQVVIAPDDVGLRCDLLVDLGHALLDAGAPRRVLDHVAPAVLELAEARGDVQRASAACQLAMGALNNEASQAGLSSAEAVTWAERADRWAPPDSVARVWADAFRGVLFFEREHSFDGIPYLTRALALARRLEDPEALWWVAWLWMTYAIAPKYADAQLQLAEEFAARPRAGVRSRTIALVLTWIAAAFLNRGLRDRAEATWHELQELAARSEQPLIRLNALRGPATRATLDGRLEDAVAIANSAWAVSTEGGAEVYARQIVPLLGHRALLHLGRANDVLQASGSVNIGLLAMAHLGQRAEVWAHLDETVVRRPHFGASADETPTYLDVYRLEAAVRVGHTAATAALVARLAATAHVTTGVRLPTCIGRHLAAGCKLLGRFREAEAHYRSTLELATAMRFRPEIALCHVGLADLLLTPRTPAERLHPERARAALEHLASATPELVAMHMQPALAQAQTLMQRAQSSVASNATRNNLKGLTRREVDILRLVAAGKSNAEIADELVISIRTAERHLANIYAKLGTGGAVARAKAIAIAHTHGLVDNDGLLADETTYPQAPRPT